MQRILVAAAACVLIWLFWGDRFLVREDPQPTHVDAAVVLQGSIAAQKARIDGAVNLLQRGIASRALLSVPKESYWGQSVPPIARSYLEHKYGEEIAMRFDFCETGEQVDSTRQEAESLRPCVEARGFRSVAIVTSDYHTRRAGMIWHGVMRADPGVAVSIEGVGEPDFHRPWWRDRRSAKTFAMESIKLLWAALGG